MDKCPDCGSSLIWLRAGGFTYERALDWHRRLRTGNTCPGQLPLRDTDYPHWPR